MISAFQEPVGKFGNFVEYCLPYVKIGGEFIPYKSGEVADELQDAKVPSSYLEEKWNLAKTLICQVQTFIVL